jgi:hypothetical protein
MESSAKTMLRLHSNGVPWYGAPDCPVCHLTVSGAPGPYKLATLGFLRARSAIIHQTVRCATGLSGVTAE